MGVPPPTALVYISPAQTAKPKTGKIHIATGFTGTILVITGMAPDTPITKTGGIRERDGLENDNDIVVLSPAGVLPF